MPTEDVQPVPVATPGMGPRQTRLRHDLRTFVNNITGYAELVVEDAQELRLAAVVEALQELQRACTRSVEVMTAFPWVPDTPVGPEHYAPLERDLLAFVENVLRIVDRAGGSAMDDGGEALLPDLAKIRRAAIGLRQLAGTTGQEATAPTDVATLILPALTGPDGAGAAGTAPARLEGCVLVVDDNEANRDLLARLLEREGLEVHRASGGAEGLDALAARAFDLVLLDLIMGDMDGITVLRRMRADPALAHVPAIMLSAVDELPTVVACLEAGAEDYVAKPFNAVLLRSRVRVVLERKQFGDRERRRAAQLEAALRGVEVQKRISEELLANILPEEIARELQEKGYASPKYFEDVTVVLTDFVGFTSATELLSADELVEVLNSYFTAFDRIVDRYGLEKLKTSGDSYMFASGLPQRSASHPVDAVLAALEMLEEVRDTADTRPVDWRIRVGIHTGPVIAGIVGIRKFAFDVWGETVNLTARMEAACEPNRLNLSERTFARVKDFFVCEPRGRILIKEGRELEMYFANTVTPKLLDDLSVFPPPSFERRYQSYFQKPPRSFPKFLMTSPPDAP